MKPANLLPCGTPRPETHQSVALRRGDTTYTSLPPLPDGTPGYSVISIKPLAEMIMAMIMIMALIMVMIMMTII
jgi:hypothetical protein